MYLLDTNIIIYSLKNNKIVNENLKKYKNSLFAISIITYGELIFGAEKSQQKTNNLAKIHEISEIFPILNLSSEIMNIFGSLKASLQKNGTIIDDMDLFIAATAIVNNYTLVTNNTKHFNRIEGLLLTDWTKI